MTLRKITARAFSLMSENFLHFQGFGGNVSIKNKDCISIKRSGVSLFPTIPEKFITMSMSENKIIEGEGRPSMELGMHKAFGHKYVFHSHWLPIFLGHMPTSYELDFDSDSVSVQFMDFCLPGAELELRIKVIASSRLDQIVYLRNHGLVIACETLDQLNNILSRLEQSWTQKLSEERCSPAYYASGRQAIANALKGIHGDRICPGNADMERIGRLGPDFFIILGNRSEPHTESSNSRELALAGTWLLALEKCLVKNRLEMVPYESLKPLLSMEAEQYRMNKASTE